MIIKKVVLFGMKKILNGGFLW